MEHEKFYCEDLRIFWVGDPLIHPEFNKFIEMLINSNAVAEKLISRIGFDTNATFLDNSKIEILIKLGRIIPVHILFSLDAVTAETYDQIRVGGDFERVFNNIQQFYIIRQKNNAVYPKAAVQFIVQEKNYDELKSAKVLFENFFKQHNISSSILLNASFAEEDGITFRPLTEQNDNGTLQEKANKTFEKFCRETHIIRSDQNIDIISQGGGKIIIS